MCLSRILLTLLCVGMLAGCQRGNSPADPGASLGGQAPSDLDTTSVVSATEVPAVFIPPVAELLGHVNPAQDTAFEALPARMSSRSGLFMRKEASAAFQRMYDAAKEEETSRNHRGNVLLPESARGYSGHIHNQR